MRGALTNGLFLILGAFIAAATATFGSVVLQSRSDHRDDRLTQQHATGAARVLFSEFLESANEMTVLGHDRIIRPFTRAYRIQMSPSDMTLIAATLPAEDWGTVQQSLVAVQGLDTFITSLLADGKHRLTPYQVCLVHDDLIGIRWAALALAPLAGAPGRDTPPNPMVCREPSA